MRPGYQILDFLLTFSIWALDIKKENSLYSHLVLVSQTPQVPGWLTQIVAAAMQKQLSRDFRPIWEASATVNAFDMLEDVPTGYWPIIIRDDIQVPGAAGIHLDADKQPFGLVQFSNAWTLTTSHEILEMLVDPMGIHLRAGNSIKPDQGRVEYLVEVCDPSEAAEFGYLINGVLVSDFYTPDFFLPIEAKNVRYSFSGAIAKPRSILKGGYISWLDPETDNWWQQTWFTGNAPKFVNLGQLSGAKGSFRTQIDQLTLKSRSKPSSLNGLPRSNKVIKNSAKTITGCNHAARARALALQKTVDALVRATSRTRGKKVAN